MNFVGETVWKASTKVRKVSSPTRFTRSWLQPAGLAVEESPAGDLGAVEEAAQGDLVGDHLQGARGGETAAMLARAAGVGHQAVLQVAEGIAPLEDLDRRVAAVGVPRDLAVVAVLLDRAAGAVTVEVVVRVVGPGHRVDAAEEEVARRAAAGRGDALRHGLAERFQQEIDQLRLQVGVAADARARDGRR